MGEVCDAPPVRRALLLLVLLGCHPLPPMVTLEGRAENAKGGAAVVLDGGGVVYLRRLESWPAAVRGKRVAVTGRRTTEKLLPEPTVGPAGERSAGAQGTQDVLDDATWTVSPDQGSGPRGY